MHEFLLEFKQWQESEPLRGKLRQLKAREEGCLKECKGEPKCVQVCQQTRNVFDRFMYKKQSQFI